MNQFGSDIKRSILAIIIFYRKSYYLEDSLSSPGNKINIEGNKASFR